MATTVIEQDTDSMELTAIARAAIWGGFKGAEEQSNLDRYREYADGRAGIPDVREGASDEIKELALQAVRNVCGIVVDTFDRGLTVTGFRSPTSSDDEPAWAWWQTNRLDARQHEVHRASLTYGWSWVSVLPDDDRAGGKPVPVTWSPMNVYAEWGDPRRDLFPLSATLVRAVKHPLFGRGWSVMFLDELTVTEGFVPKKPKGKPSPRDLVILGESWEHGATYAGVPVVPLVWFPNELTTDDRMPRGEVEPLIQEQRAINSVNFDRLAVSRFSAFKQKVVIGWTAAEEEVARASATAVWTFEDSKQDIDVKQLDASPLAPYDDLLREMTEHVALMSGVPAYQITGSLQNVSQETAALAEAPMQRKLKLKQDIFGEQWEIVIRLAMAMAGEAAPDEAAEVLWAQTEARSFAGVVDGIFKLATIPQDAQGIPVEELLDLIPGMNQQKLLAIKTSLASRRADVMTAMLTQFAPEQLNETADGG
jgi:hypothetical protein